MATIMLLNAESIFTNVPRSPKRTINPPTPKVLNPSKTLLCNIPIKRKPRNIARGPPAKLR